MGRGAFNLNNKTNKVTVVTKFFFFLKTDTTLYIYAN